MKRDFAFWLQGFFEISDGEDAVPERSSLTSAQTRTIRAHLALVFKHEIDPSMGGPAVQQDLNAIHEKAKAATEPDRPPGSPFSPVMRC